MSIDNPILKSNNKHINSGINRLLILKKNKYKLGKVCLIKDGESYYHEDFVKSDNRLLMV